MNKNQKRDNFDNYVDALMEVRSKVLSAKDTVNGQRFEIPSWVIGDNTRKMFAEEVAQQCADLLSSANGKRRTRILDQYDLAGVVLNGIKHGYDYIHGGTVANAYGYPACTTIALAYRRGRYITVGVGKARANGPSLTQAWREFYGHGNMTNTAPGTRDKLLRKWARLK